MSTELVSYLESQGWKLKDTITLDDGVSTSTYWEKGEQTLVIEHQA